MKCGVENPGCTCPHGLCCMADKALWIASPLSEWLQTIRKTRAPCRLHRAANTVLRCGPVAARSTRISSIWSPWAKSFLCRDGVS